MHDRQIAPGLMEDRRMGHKGETVSLHDATPRAEAADLATTLAVIADYEQTGLHLTGEGVPPPPCHR